MRVPLVAGNWKMQGTRDEAAQLVDALKVAGLGESRAEALICPPFVYLPEVAEQLSDAAVALGAQNVSEHEPGAYTGEVAAAMLADVGCRYVIVGHSERRGLFGEASEQVAAKFRAAQAQGLTPVLCLGETLAERDAGRAEAVVAEQLAAVMDTAGVEALERAVLAYEPVWAIGTGKTAAPQQAQEMHGLLRERVADKDAGVAERLRILYGGSVKGANAGELFAEPDIDGALVGGASLKSDEFAAIYRAAG